MVEIFIATSVEFFLNSYNNIGILGFQVAIDIGPGFSYNNDIETISDLKK